ncbi:MAG: hypothetical protein QM765_30750 [Myxococcales bacterium]
MSSPPNAQRTPLGYWLPVLAVVAVLATLAGIWLDASTIDGSSVDAEPALPLPLTAASILFHTNDDDRDRDTNESISIRCANETVAALSGDFGGKTFREERVDGPFSLDVTGHPHLESISDCQLRIDQSPHGNDTWRFNVHLTLGFSNGETSQTKNYDFNGQSSKTTRASLSTCKRATARGRRNSPPRWPSPSTEPQVAARARQRPLAPSETPMTSSARPFRSELLVSLLSCLPFMFAATAAAQPATAVCTPVDATHTRCRVSNPVVDKPSQTYPAVVFRPGDLVTISAGGCVQTCGKGATWKRYIDPSGPNSDRLYHGLIQIPGAMASPARLARVIGHPVTVSLEAAGGPLLLGYEDDDYNKNGYWGHDDGTENQCKGVGNAWVELLIERGGVPGPRCPNNPPADLATACCFKSAAASAQEDADHDGLPDRCEDLLAERYAPVVYHSTDESNFPTNVDWLLAKTVLSFFDDDCTPDLSKSLVAQPTQAKLLDSVEADTCGAKGTIRSGGTRSAGKHRTFYLRDAPAEARVGSRDTRDWKTYVHAYLNDLGGVTLQYWRFYAFNDASNDHGGDWEGVHVILDRNLSPVAVGLLGHTSIDEKPWSAFTRDGTHPRIFSEGGGHASHETGAGIQAQGCPARLGCSVDPARPSTFVRQETWTGGVVSWPDGRKTTSGPLVNVGEKSSPLNGQVFVQYSGLWGSPGTLAGTSGYWGPAFNETDMGKDGFITAWCRGATGLDITRECYPAATSE